ncbi:hypothetical protein BDV96DRAFT_597973 [Lophiotrema nucula]|uniref:Uncharacterized protein n=1 Tax=Lophiotrema nucula TaxID=690887 RepID=A0A6A5ZCU6_9PLEO|nr:hypothetical protein BDV96DRAFT_597973 [Lophiotrema nucula]
MKLYSDLTVEEKEEVDSHLSQIQASWEIEDITGVIPEPLWPRREMPGLGKKKGTIQPQDLGASFLQRLTDLAVNTPGRIEEVRSGWRNIVNQRRGKYLKTGTKWVTQKDIDALKKKLVALGPPREDKTPEFEQHVDSDDVRSARRESNYAVPHPEQRMDRYDHDEESEPVNRGRRRKRPIQEEREEAGSHQQTSRENGDITMPLDSALFSPGAVQSVRRARRPSRTDADRASKRQRLSEDDSDRNSLYSRQSAPAAYTSLTYPPAGGERPPIFAQHRYAEVPRPKPLEPALRTHIQALINKASVPDTLSQINLCDRPRPRPIRRPRISRPQHHIDQGTLSAERQPISNPPTEVPILPQSFLRQALGSNLQLPPIGPPNNDLGSQVMSHDVQAAVHPRDLQGVRSELKFKLMNIRMKQESLKARRCDAEINECEWEYAVTLHEALETKDSGEHG